MMKVFNIEWDTDGEVIEGLPTEVELDNNIDPDEVADILSDTYGFCVFGFVMEMEGTLYH